MVVKVADPVIVVDAAVGFHLILGAQAVFHDKQRLLIAIPQHVQQRAQAEGVNLPAPLRACQVRVRHHAENIAARLFVQLFVGGHAAGHIVAEGDKIDGLFQGFAIGIGNLKANAVVAEIAQHIARVSAAALDIAKELPAAVLLQGFKNIVRFAAERIHQAAEQHIADFALRHDVMAGLSRQRARHQLMVNSLVDFRFAAVGRQTDAGHRRVQGHIDFIKGQPQFDLRLVARKHRTGVAFEEANDFAIAPAAVVFHQRPRHLIVGQGYQRSNIVLRHFIKQLIVEGQPGFVWLRLIAVGENTRPGNRYAQAVKAHLGKEADIFRITVVKIDGDILNAAIAGHAFYHIAKYAARLDVRSG